MNKDVMRMRKIQLSLNGIRHIAFQGLKRAMTFSAMAITGKYNATEITNYDTANLTIGNPQLHNVQESELESFAKEFKNWTLLNSICEIYECFYTFVDELLIAVKLLNEQKMRILNETDYWKIRDEIKNSKISLEYKIKSLCEDYNICISKEYNRYFSFLEGIRHCVTHNHGFVVEKYFPNSVKGNVGCARIECLETKFYCIDDKGRKRKLKIGASVKQGELMEIRVTKYIKEAPYNKVLQIDFDDLNKIVFTIFNIINLVTKEASPVFEENRQKEETITN